MSDPRESKPAGGLEKSTKPKRKLTRRILLVDPSPALKPALQQCEAEHGSVQVVYASTLAKARNLVKSKDAGKIDIAVLNHFAKAGELELAKELTSADVATRIVLLTDQPDFTYAQQAMQLGSLDLIIRPDTQDTDQDWLVSTTQRVTDALNRQWTERMRSSRIRKLKRLCKKLDAARNEVSEQVDVLCNDLVTAYQELAVQMQSLSHTSGYIDAIGEELDLEAVLRKTLEYIIKQAGPCNAAVFLPSSADEFALGGYVNYDCTKESADMLLEHLADVLAPRIAENAEDMLHVTANDELDALLGDDWNYLADCHLVALPAVQDGEALAVLTLFRDNDQPFSQQAIDALHFIGSEMGELLGRIIRVHHRAVPGFDEVIDPVDPSDGFLPPSEWHLGADADDDDEPENEEDDGLAY